MLLNVLQSVELNKPRADEEAVGILNVCVLTELEILKSLPLVPVPKNWTCSVKLFKAVNPVVNVVIIWHRLLSSVWSVIVLPAVFTSILTANLSVRVNTV